MLSKQSSSFAPWLRALRDAWLIVGLSIGMIAVLECAVRGYAWLFPRSHSRATAYQGGPYESKPWIKSFLAARRLHVCCDLTDYDPYRGWWGVPGNHADLNVDAAGYRRTDSPTPVAETPAREVFLFGGSTMWGYTARDAFTIPSRVGVDLAAAGISDVGVRNKAQSAFNLTQGMLTLMLELRGGARPDAVVFLDGVNEIGVVAEGEEVGDVYGERIARERHRNWTTIGSLRRLALGSRLLRAVARTSRIKHLSTLDPATACPEIAEHYANLVRMGRSLGREFGFTPIFFWQPTLAMSHKPLGPWEKHLTAEPDLLGSRMLSLTRACAPQVDARFADQSDYVRLHALFDAEPGDVFLDHFGHVTEEANDSIARVITERLLPVLARSSK